MCYTENMDDRLCRQIAADYCCSPEAVLDHQNHFSMHRFLERRRRFQEGKDCFLKVAAINGKLLFTGNEEMIAWCREKYESHDSEWFMEAKTLRQLNDRLHTYGYQIEMVHPFFIAETITEINTEGTGIRWYTGDDIEHFRGDGRFCEAYAFCPDVPDVLGVSAENQGVILGMAGASCDSPSMWQIGINVMPQGRGRGIGKMLVTLLKNEILKKGILPYYGTSVSHIASQRVALGAGFLPAWTELSTSKIS